MSLAQQFSNMLTSTNEAHDLRDLALDEFSPHVKNFLTVDHMLVIVFEDNSITFAVDGEIDTLDTIEKGAAALSAFTVENPERGIALMQAMAGEMNND